MKLPQIKTFIVNTDLDWALGDYEMGVTEIVNEFLLENAISSDDLIDIKISTCAIGDSDSCAEGVYCTIVVVYNKEITEEE